MMHHLKTPEGCFSPSFGLLHSLARCQAVYFVIKIIMKLKTYDFKTQKRMLLLVHTFGFMPQLIVAIKKA